MRAKSARKDSQYIFIHFLNKVRFNDGGFFQFGNNDNKQTKSESI